MKRIALAMFLAVTLASCATTPRVNTDFDPAAQFAGFRTYTWLMKPQGVSPLVEQRIVEGIDAQLAAQGWTQVENGDIAVAAHVATADRMRIDTFYSGSSFNQWGWRGHQGWRGHHGAMHRPHATTTTVRNYTVGTLIVDLFDSGTKQAIWRGTAEQTVPSSPDRVNTSVQAGIDRMFADFPPGS
ncbi:DUF4136 domain-containing protein [Luteimonas sp. A649]